jgi:hypothetical protein
MFVVERSFKTELQWECQSEAEEEPAHEQTASTPISAGHTQTCSAAHVPESGALVQQLNRSTWRDVHLHGLLAKSKEARQEGDACSSEPHAHRVGTLCDGNVVSRPFFEDMLGVVNLDANVPAATEASNVRSPRQRRKLEHELDAGGERGGGDASWYTRLHRGSNECNLDA